MTETTFHKRDSPCEAGPKTSAQDALERIRVGVDGAITSHAGESEAWRQELYTKLRALGLVFAMHIGAERFTK